MKLLYIVLFLSLLILISCDKKLVNKEFKIGDDTITWYFYSDITSNSPDYVDIVHNDSTITIIEARQILKDVEMKNDTIILYHLPLSHKRMKLMRRGRVFNYLLKYEEVSSAQMYDRWLKKKHKNDRSDN